MSTYAYGVGLAIRDRREEEGLAPWRKRSAELHSAALLRRQQYHVDCASLDRTAGVVSKLLDRGVGPHVQLVGLRELIKDFRRVIAKAEEKGVDTYTLRRKLESFEQRASNLYEEMRNGQRAAEFDQRNLRGILEDYRKMRS